MNITEFYDITSGNLDDAKRRLMNETMVLRFVKKFMNDPSFAELSAAIDSGSAEDAFRAAHTLKGVCQNLAFTRLADSASRITELLRGASDISYAMSVFPEVKADYESVINAIRELD